ncbi:hypothetical protein [Bacillus sp. SG-1]|uniref:hypothetical protein n=1 Tax=Bacillus sp. SG-1 TaxID=161544 RepID=UPI0001544D81|nr:hypothetical protein [Bacillus sp. SG-1]EDL63216.1 hypothetical protein BSG1_17065 [Bacillus sp. SG-1]
MKKAAISLGISLLTLAGCGTIEESTEANPAEAEAVKEIQQENFVTETPDTKVNGSTDNDSDMNKEKAENVLNQYKGLFMEVINEGSQLEEYENKDEIIQHFSSIMTTEYAESLVDLYIKEENGELSVVATETPIWLQEDQEFDLEKVTDQEYHAVQNIDNQLRGKKGVIFTLVMEEGSWVVADVTTGQVEEEEEQYKTGTDDRMEDRDSK